MAEPSFGEQIELAGRQRFTLSCFAIGIAIEVVNNLLHAIGVLGELSTQAATGVAILVGGIGLVRFITPEFKLARLPATLMFLAFVGLAVEVTARVVGESGRFPGIPIFDLESDAFATLNLVTEITTLTGLFVGMVIALTSARRATIEASQWGRDLADQLNDQWESDRTLEALVRATSNFTGEDFLHAFAAGLAEAFRPRCVMIARYRSDVPGAEIEPVAGWPRAELEDQDAFAAEGTPCGCVVRENQTVFHGSEVMKAFPNCQLLAGVNAQSYIGVPIHGHDGAVLGHLAVIHETPQPHSERNEWLMELFAARAAAEFERIEYESALVQNAQTVTAAEDAITTVDLGGKVISWNDGAKQLYGYTAEEMIGESLAKLLNPDELDTEMQMENFRTAAAAGDTMSNAIVSRKRKDGRVIWVSVSSFPLYADDGSIRAFSGIARDVTESVERDRALRESEERMRTFFDNIPDAVRVLDPNGVVKFTNQPNESNPLGDPFIGRSITEAIDDDQQEKAIEAFMRARKTGKKATTTIYSATIDKTYHVQIVPINDANGDLVEFLILGTDVSERIAHEREIREAERKYRFLAESMRDVLWSIDKDLNYTYVSPSVESIMGYTVEETLGKSIVFNVPGGDTDMPLKYAEMALRGDGDGYELALEQRVKHKDGTDLYLDVSAVALRDDDGNVVGFQGVSRDITQRRRTEKELREKDEQYRLIVETSHEGIVMIDNENRIIFVNDRLSDMCGFRPNEMVGRDLGEFVFDEDQESSGAIFDQMRGGASNHFELRFKNRIGNELWVNASVSLLRDDAGGVRGIIALMTDITERRADAESRRELEAQVQHAQKLESLGVLAGGIAHDFNNLLAGIMGYASLLSQDLDERDPARGYVQKIELASARATELTKQMLAYSGKGKYVLEDVNISKLTAEMLDLIHASISKKAHVEFELSDNVRPVRADAGQISQVIMNLVINASDALDDDPGSIGVRTFETEVESRVMPDNVLRSELEPGAFAVLEVTDTGCGMDSATLTRIFDPFFTTKFTGRGLGLAAVQGIVRGHGGAITVKSAEGAGTTMCMLLPVVTTVVESEVPTPGATTQRDDTSISGNVLIVDDDQVIRTLAGEVLGRAGMSVETAANGREAVEIFEKDPNLFAVILLDYTMPEMNGRETFLAIREIRGDIPIIMSSGYSERDAMQDLRADQHVYFVQKPYPMHRLTSTVRDAIELASESIESPK